MSCNVDDPNKMGEIPLINKRKICQCPKVIVNGEKYREVNGLLFETDREVKTYPNKDEWREIKRKKKEEIREKEERKRLKELEESIRKGLHEISLKERVQQMMGEGAKRGEVAKKLKISLYMVDKISKGLILEGKANPFIGLVYSDETNEKIITMAKQGKSYREISEAVDKPYKGVQGKILKWKKEMGIKWGGQSKNI